MQNWNDQIRQQLNDLPGFPPTPTGSPPGTPATPLEWILGDWIQECRVRPAAATFASLPVTGNGAGDIRASIADQAWYMWDGAAWQPMGGGGGGVASVTGLAPINVTPGANPVISFPSWPANAPGALTNNGAGTLSWAPAPTAGVVDVSSTALEVIAAGDLLRYANGGVEKADATTSAALLEPVGFATAAQPLIGGPVTIRVAGLADVPAALFDVAPIAGNVGKRVWLSTTAGKVTVTASVTLGDVVQRAGILATLAGGSGGAPQVLVQIGDPTAL
jgi:hypothetical protein